jgi:hypothetical protein
MLRYITLLTIVLALTVGCTATVAPEATPTATTASQTPAPTPTSAPDGQPTVDTETDLETLTPQPVETRPGRPTPAGTLQHLETVTPRDEGTPVVGETPLDLLEAIIADLVQRTGVDPQAIEVVRAEEVVWNDGSLGCPEPGVFYTQALVSGYRVVLQVGDETYDYRATESGAFRLCESGTLGAPGSTGDDPKR